MVELVIDAPKDVAIVRVDFDRHPPDLSLWDMNRYAEYVQQCAVPYAHHEHGVWIAIADDAAINHQVRAWFPKDEVHFCLTTQEHIRSAVQHHVSSQWMDDAIHGLSRTYPHYALCGNVPARPLWMRGVLMGVMLGIIALIIAYAQPTQLFSWMISLASMIFMSMIIFKGMLMCVGHRVRHEVYAMTHQAPIIPDEDLPIYSVLVPMVHEAQSVAGIIKSLSALDYPHENIELWLILEAHDHATIEAVRQYSYDARFRVLIVPDAAPRTKPKACNYALPCIRGEFVTIYDAEDAPNPQQLRHAVAMFRHYPEVGCLQASLNWYNWNECWLTRLFHVEYAMLFRVLLPALYRLGIPIPLGGTSNHIRVDMLRRAGGWDAFNVTEDADLGIRLASMGIATLPMDGLTLEEAPLSISAWVKQRTRWIKGYMQSWRVMQRCSVDRYRAMGGIGWLGIHYVIGLSSVIYVIAPVMWCLGWMMYFAWDIPLTPRAQTYAWGVFIAGWVMQWWSVWSMRSVRGCHVSLTVIACYPLYFVLHGIAGIRAAWQLCGDPYRWEKTEHGKTRVARYSAYR